MKKIIIPISTLFVVGISYAQTLNLSTNENYVYSKIYLTDPTASAPKSSETIQYFDGLGRAKQIVNIKASPLQKDVVKHIEYDAFGRQAKDFLPVPQSNTLNGAIVSNPLGNAIQTNIYGSEKIYSEKILENSPLDRIQQQIQVGNDWSNKPVKFDYDTNIHEDYVRQYETTTTWVEGRTETSVQLLQYFPPNQLYKNTITDEDGNKTIEFKNGRGKVVLVRKVLSPTENADTYYVYNEYDQLAFVIPPLASAPTVEPSTMENLYYQYRYDERNRLVEKKIPGKGWEYMVYDKAGRLVATQDSNLRLEFKWLFTKYDKFGRVLYTGISIDNGDRNAVQTWITNTYGINIETAGTYTQSGLQIYYANTAYPQNIESILSVNYYDSYLPGDPFPTMVYDQVVLPSNVQQYGVSTKGLPVSSFVKNIEDNNWTKTYMYYDLKGRLIREYSQNHLGGYTNIEKRLDFSGNPNIVLTQHKRLATDTERVITEVFTYDHQNRLMTHTHQVDNNPVEYLAQNEYNELSQLKTKKVGGTSSNTPLQQVDYTYNIRGWMTQINNPEDLNEKLFGYAIKYNNPADPSLSVPKFNGNIAEVDWSKSNGGILKRYSYNYDPLNRLTQAVFSEPNLSVPVNELYNETMDYDINGNILHLYRNAPSYYGTAEQIDNLSYDYDGNRLSSVNDGSGNPTGYEGGGNTISYDSNGNMLDMYDKQIEKITYNHLNLPNKLKIDSYNKSVSYLYRADGTKLKKSFISTTNNGSVHSSSTEYLDGFHYASSTGDELWQAWYEKIGHAYEPEAFISLINTSSFDNVLKFVPTAEGFYDFENNEYIYQYKDHLGNVRVSYKKQNNGLLQVTDSNDYYPFGMSFVRNPEDEAYFGLGSYTNYKYNGKELQETGMYDYGARFYMPDIGRWGVVDPRSQYTYETYSYVWNNPIYFNDPTGMEGEEGKCPPECPTGVTEIKILSNKEREVTIQEVIVGGKEKENNNYGPGNLAMTALLVSQADSPAPGPMDVAAAAMLIGAGVWWTYNQFSPSSTGYTTTIADPGVGMRNLKTEDSADEDKDVNGVKVPQEGKDFDDIYQEGEKTENNNIRQKNGGYEKALEDFENQEGLHDVKNIKSPYGGAGKTGKNSKGHQVTVRERSSDGRATLERKIPGVRTVKKIRY